MNKSHLVDAVVASTSLPKTSAVEVVDAIIEAIKNALATGEGVDLVGFGKFGVKERAARTGRNPKTGEPITIPKAMIPFFKPGKALKAGVASAEVS